MTSTASVVSRSPDCLEVPEGVRPPGKSVGPVAQPSTARTRHV